MDLNRLKLDRQGLMREMIAEMDMILREGSDEEQRCQREAERTPDDAMVWFELGMAHHDAGLLYANLAFECERLNYIEEHPEADIDEPRTVTISLPRLKEVFERALVAFDKAEAIDSEFYGINCQRGIVYCNMHEYEKAQECLLKAIEEDEEDSIAIYNLAQVYHEMGQDELCAKYQSMLEDSAWPDGALAVKKSIIIH